MSSGATSRPVGIAKELVAEAIEALARRLKTLDIPIKYLSPPEGEEE